MATSNKNKLNDDVKKMNTTKEDYFNGVQFPSSKVQKNTQNQLGDMTREILHSNISKSAPGRFVSKQNHNANDLPFDYSDDAELARRLSKNVHIEPSLSSIATYSSLSDQIPDKQEVATQIITTTPTKLSNTNQPHIQASQRRSVVSADQLRLVMQPLESYNLIDDNISLNSERNNILMNANTFMPISSALAYYPYNCPTSKHTEQLIKIKSKGKMSKSYYNQFKEIQTKSAGVLPQQRSKTFAIPKRDTQSLPSYPIPKIKQSSADVKSKQQQKTTRPTTSVMRNKPINNTNEKIQSSSTSTTTKNGSTTTRRQMKVVAHELKKDNLNNNTNSHRTILKHNTVNNNDQRRPVRFADQQDEYSRRLLPNDDYFPQNHLTYFDTRPVSDNNNNNNYNNNDSTPKYIIHTQNSTPYVLTLPPVVPQTQPNPVFLLQPPAIAPPVAPPYTYYPYFNGLYPPPYNPFHVEPHQPDNSVERKTSSSSHNIKKNIMIVRRRSHHTKNDSSAAGKDKKGRGLRLRLKSEAQLDDDSSSSSSSSSDGQKEEKQSKKSSPARSKNHRPIYQTDSDSDNENTRNSRRTVIVKEPSAKRKEVRLVRKNGQLIREPDTYYGDSDHSARSTKIIYVDNQNRTFSHRPRSKYVYMNDNNPRQSDIVYVNEPSRVQYVPAPTRSRRHRTSSKTLHGDDIVYVDDNSQPIEYVEYIDEQPAEYVEYVYENDPVISKSAKSNIVYVDEPHSSRYYKKQQPSATTIVYQ
ncbi:unnamed protein product [Didymodactylos carnosus]|uniref:Uncharacterized protein n=1 Tax=Didymodactylos carnosus TaxID=1234261 RepID=A0A813RWM9_9BILA|nr:unnamed protein product [Didymodactylos carnosus]CAF3574858.1 unnamed protein product [Didymodactylos carnosus]